MEPLLLNVAIGIVSLAAGILISMFVTKKIYTKKGQEAEEKARLILKEAEVTAESIKKDKILEAKEKFLKLKSDFEEEATRKKNQIITNENKLKQREQNLSKQIEQIKRKEAELAEMKSNLTSV
jgi:ribonuclease Y